MQFKDYRHFTNLQIRFSDIDRLNHVNNACYLTYFETARVKYFHHVFKDNVNWAETGFVIARSEINHLKPVFLEDELYCFTKVTRLGNKSMTLKNSIVKLFEGELIECAEGIGILVAMDYSKKESMRVPDLWRVLINTFEAPRA